MNDCKVQALPCDCQSSCSLCCPTCIHGSVELQNVIAAVTNLPSAERVNTCKAPGQSTQEWLSLRLLVREGQGQIKLRMLCKRPDRKCSCPPMSARCNAACAAGWEAVPPTTRLERCKGAVSSALRRAPWTPSRAHFASLSLQLIDSVASPAQCEADVDNAHMLCFNLMGNKQWKVIHLVCGWTV